MVISVDLALTLVHSFRIQSQLQLHGISENS